MKMHALDEIDRRIVVATQAGLPLVSRPYHAVAEAVGIGAEEVMARLQRMRERGIVRRIALVPNHYALGFRANGMAVWDVDDERVDTLGARIAALPFVSHCYRRGRTLPRWPYNLFVMMHGLRREDVYTQADTVARLLGDAVRGHDILFSTRILKKAGLRLRGAALASGSGLAAHGTEGHQRFPSVTSFPLVVSEQRPTRR
jgi:DNA-binding Lrp family transcriptional regulator